MSDPEETIPGEHRRRTDDGWLCWLALRSSEAWEWIDKRRIDRHLLSLGIFIGTINITMWAMEFAWYSSRPGIEIAAIIAAVSAPYMALQSFAATSYFKDKQ